MKYTEMQVKRAISKWQKLLESCNEKEEIVVERKLTRTELDEFYRNLQNGEVNFKFIKKDGSERVARGTLSPNLMPNEAALRQQYGADYDDMMRMFQERKDFMVYFWDLENNGFRQFHVSRFEGYVSPEREMTCEQFSQAISSNPQYKLVFNDGEHDNELLGKVLNVNIVEQSHEVHVTLVH